MSAPTFRLVFQGKIAPDQDLAEVKGRLQKLFKKDAATIDKMFGGKKVCLKQGLSQSQAQQYQEKMRSIGVLCEIEEPQAPKPKASPLPAPTPLKSSVSQPAASIATPVKKESAPDKPLKLGDIDKAFIGTIPKVELPGSYKAGIVAVGITMVLLPIIYVGLIAILGLGVMSHALVNVSWIQSIGYKFGILAYITPIIVGATIILFMVKPLFAKAATAPKTLKLDPLKEPVFFHFVNKIAMAVGAPRPKEIEVDCQVNASASFRKGLFSFFGNDLVLTIGMPLLAGFNTRQLAGVLAHEFGHFSQGAGMRFHYLTYKVNNWFFNAVYLRDSWDEKLDEAAEESDGWVSIILNFARGGVWLTRKILYLFMMAGHAVSSYMLRQMEFDADRYEAQMAGSEQFKDTSLQLQRLSVAFQISHDQLAQAWEDKKLVDNLPRLILHNAEQLPEELDRALLSQIEESKTQVYDSHPSDNERIDNAMAQQAKGIFELNSDIRGVFKSFDAMSKQVSYSYYAHELGLEFDRNKLVDISEVVQISQDNEKQQEAYHEYFKDMAPVFEFPISVNIFDTSKTDWDDLLDQYRIINNQIVEQIGQRRKLMLQANDSYEKYQVFAAIHVLRESGFILFPQWFNLDERTLGKYKEHFPKLEQAWQQVMQQLGVMFELNDQRLSIALTLLNHPLLIEANKDHASHLKARNRLSLLINNVKRNAEYITDFEFKHFKLATLLSCAPLMGQKPDDMQTMLQNLLEEVKQSYDQLTAALGRLDYPFVAEGENLTIADYIADFLPKQKHTADECQYYIQSGQVILEKVESIYARIISGLANIALSVDQLIPSIYGEQRLDEQVEHQQNEMIGTVADTQSNLAYKQTDEISALSASSNEAEVTPETEPVANAVFALDEATPVSEEKNEQHEAEVADISVAEQSSSENLQSSTEIAADEGSPKEELFSQESPLAEMSSTEEEKKEVTQISGAGTKAVFAIDEVADDKKETSEQEQTPQVVDSGTKAVFAIDEPENSDSSTAEDEKISDAQSASESAGKAVFSIDESSDTNTEAEAEEKENLPEEAVASDASLDAGLAFERNETSVKSKSNNATVDAPTEQTVESQEQPGLSFDTADLPLAEGSLSTEEASRPESTISNPSSSHGSELSLSLDTAGTPGQADSKEHTAQATASSSELTLEPMQPEDQTKETSEVKSEASESENVGLVQEQPKVFESKAQVLTLAPVGTDQEETKTEETAEPAKEDAASKLELEISTSTNESESVSSQSPTDADNTISSGLTLEPMEETSSVSSEQSVTSEDDNKESSPQDPPQAAQS